MKKSRLEAFSDGVLAIIITIMVLELRVPEGHGWADLSALWPKFLSYLISFIYVGIYWNNHHHVLHTVRRVNGSVLWANLHLLFWLSLLPFVSGWAGESRFAPEPLTAYGVVAMLAGLAYTLFIRALLRSDSGNAVLSDLLGDFRKGYLSMVGYAVAIVAPFLGAWGSWVSGAMLVAVALVWLIPDRRIERVLEREPQG
ncbi:TMEM175 family protein [Deinococcus koreensis]|uniref:DUF1211 domain-containing protein n=1 Tax=Deinococcus koreensis TaxID=2054903 RepID=A0A2K3UXZ4_9DEIO|nr:TMEM175 family protein [Deinococcus koreensis]PNY81412.1 hypothetical protein CVO96_08465 [Deinococcus koreensis]